MKIEWRKVGAFEKIEGHVWRGRVVAVFGGGWSRGSMFRDGAMLCQEECICEAVSVEINHFRFTTPGLQSSLPE